MSGFRVEKDGLGEVKVAADAYYGPQTQRACENFAIGEERMPLAVIQAYAKIKKACAQANKEQGVITKDQAQAIMKTCDKLLTGELNQQFPLKIWQSGSGTQTNMNVNEVISYCAQKMTDIHPNDHVNASQSSNDTFPTAMHIALSEVLIEDLLPELRKIHQEMEKKIVTFKGVTRIGRTHLQDAVPITLSQSFSAYAQFLKEAIDNIHLSLEKLYIVPLGGTAVGTGLNTIEGFAEKATAYLSQYCKMPLSPSSNPFSLLTSHNAICSASNHISILASNLNKMANDIRLLGSGPRCGIGELILPSNEPGSSIMPGKVNPTQCEAMSMVCLKVINNHQLVLQCNAEGHLELNTYKPLIIHTVLQSVRLITDACASFRKHALHDLQANSRQIEKNLEQSLMLITALKPVIGYEACTKIALHAYENNLTLKASGLELSLVTEAVFDQYVRVESMISPDLSE